MNMQIIDGSLISIVKGSWQESHRTDKINFYYGTGLSNYLSLNESRCPNNYVQQCDLERDYSLQSADKKYSTRWMFYFFIDFHDE